MADRDPKTGQFLKGYKGGGRTKGARNKLGEAFLADMLHAWEESGSSAIQEVIEKRPHDFLKVVAGILPRDINLNLNDMESMTDEQLVDRIRKLDSAIRPFLDAQGAAGNSEGVGPATTH